MKLSDVTIVVPTRNEEGNIDAFLDSVPDGINLIIVDSSTDRTTDIIGRRRRRNTGVVTVEANIPEARQLGADMSTTPWVLFTDADVIFPPDYFGNLAQQYPPPSVGGIVGTKSTAAGFDTYHRWFLRGQRALNLFGVPSATGSNMLLRRAALTSVGGFDASLAVNEDTEVMFRITKAGYRVDFDPSLVVLATDHRRLEAGLVRKVLHGAVRNTALWLGVFGPQVRSGDWGYWDGRHAVEANR